MGNELHQLIDFLKGNKVLQDAVIAQAKEVELKKTGTKKVDLKKTEVEKLEVKEPEVKKPDVNITSLIQDLQTNIHSDVPSKKKTSKGFDVQKFEFLMRSKLIDEYKKLQSFDRPYISVGELCSCTRKCYYERKKYEVDVNELFRFSYLALLQEVGNFVHKFIQSIYGFTESEKTIISEKYKVKGRLDSIEDNILVEFKTVDASDFSNKYSEQDYHQALIYVYILNTEYSYKIEGITIVYVLRNFKKVVPFDLEVNEKLAKSFLERAPMLLSYIEKNEIAEPIGSTIEQCNYCLYKKFCEKDKSLTQKPYEVSIKKEEVIEVKKEELQKEEELKKDVVQPQKRSPVKKKEIIDSNEAVFLL